MRLEELTELRETYRPIVTANIEIIGIPQKQTQTILVPNAVLGSDLQFYFGQIIGLQQNPDKTIDIGVNPEFGIISDVRVQMRPGRLSNILQPTSAGRFEVSSLFALTHTSILGSINSGGYSFLVNFDPRIAIKRPMLQRV